MLRCAVLCCAVPCCAMLCCAVCSAVQRSARYAMLGMLCYGRLCRRTVSCTVLSRRLSLVWAGLGLRGLNGWRVWAWTWACGCGCGKARGGQITKRNGHAVLPAEGAEWTMIGRKENGTLLDERLGEENHSGGRAGGLTGLKRGGLRKAGIPSCCTLVAMRMIKPQ